MSWPMEPLPVLSASTRLSILARMVFNCSMVPWLDLMTSLQVGGLGGLQFGVVLERAPDGALAVDVDDGVAQHADGLKAGLGVCVHRFGDILADLHGDFDGGQLALGHDAEWP